jgi:hypothetical protein
MRQLTPKIESPIPTIPNTIQPVQSRPCLPPVRTLIVGVVVLAGSNVGNVGSTVVVVDEELLVVVDRDVVVVDLDDEEVVAAVSTSKLASAVAVAPAARKAAAPAVALNGTMASLENFPCESASTRPRGTVSPPWTNCKRTPRSGVGGVVPITPPLGHAL